MSVSDVPNVPLVVDRFLRVLFVCWANRRRSRTGEDVFNSLGGGLVAESRGAFVERLNYHCVCGETVLDVDVFQKCESCSDSWVLANRACGERQLRREDLERADVVIFMEKEHAAAASAIMGM